MLTLFYKVLIFAFCFTLTLQRVCPTGQMIVTSFPTLNGDDFIKSSQGYDAMYELKKDPTSQKLYLYGYRLSEVETNTTAYFDIKEFKREAQNTWKIVFVSEPGNCIIIDNRPYIYLFETSQNDLILLQTLNLDAYSDIEANDNCSIARVRLQDGTQKLFAQSQQNTILKFPQGSIFDFYYDYGIDTSKQLKKASLNAVTSMNIDSTAFQDTPVSILNRKDLNSLIVVTKSSQNGQNTITIINTASDSKVYTRSWSGNNYVEKFIVDMNFGGNYFLIKDVKGFLLLLKITTDTNSKSIVEEITLEKDDYSKFFAEKVVVSIDGDVLIAYIGNILTYFQSLNGTLYYLSEVNSELENQAIKYEELSSARAPLIPTFIEPGQYKNCYPKINTSSANSSTGSIDISNFVNQEEYASYLTENEEIFVIQDPKVGAIKCQPQCLLCKSNGICEVCSLGYSLSSAGQCVFCSGCRSCFPSTPEVCLSCFKPYVLNKTTNMCEQSRCTELYCLSCYSNGTCQQCEKGYSVYGDKCVKCQDGCPVCKLLGPDKCDITTKICKPGFVYTPHVSKSIDYLCVECATGCMNCSVTDITNCTQCTEGFYVELNTQTKVYRCLSCMENCRSCSNISKCEKCLPGYRLNADGSKCIEKCHSSCLTCQQTNKTNCLSCYAGTLLQNGKCMLDLSCNSGKKCITCADGYVLQNGECIKCTYSDPNCQTCSLSDLTSCSKCNNGFYMNPDRQCIVCQSQCTSCQGVDSCLSCTSGYYLAKVDDSVTGKCLKCIDSCKTCSKVSYMCTSCRQGYIKDGSKCISETHVNYELTVNCPVEELVLVARKFVEVLIEFSKSQSVDTKNPLALTSNDLTINRLRSGSAIVSGLVSAFTKAQSELVASEINDKLPGTLLENGYSIISVSSKIVTPSVPVDNSTNSSTDGSNPSTPDQPSIDPIDEPSSSSSINVTIILAIVIPLAVLCNNFQLKQLFWRLLLC